MGAASRPAGRVCLQRRSFMARARLGRYEIEDYELPPVCAKCGARSAVRPPKTFSWHPSWVIVTILLGLLVYVVLALVLTKRMTVPLPLCKRHRSYWRNRALFVYGGLAGLALLAVGGGVLGSLLDDGGGSSPYLPIFMSVGLLFVLWVFAAAILQGSSIRPAEITDRSITLIGLSEDFIEAVRDDRRHSDEDEDEEERPRARRRTPDEDDGGYYDPDARRRVRRRKDEDDR
jgi:hypothetical protein